jgi:hypothetical protein
MWLRDVTAFLHEMDFISIKAKVSRYQHPQRTFAGVQKIWVKLLSQKINTYNFYLAA